MAVSNRATPELQAKLGQRFWRLEGGNADNIVVGSVRGGAGLTASGSGGSASMPPTARHRSSPRTYGAFPFAPSWAQDNNEQSGPNGGRKWKPPAKEVVRGKEPVRKPGEANGVDPRDLRDRTEELYKESSGALRNQHARQEESKRLQAQLDSLQAENDSLKAENERLNEVVKKLQQEPPKPPDASPSKRIVEDVSCSESRLRAVMTSNATSQQMKSAIQAVEALVVEARRELDAKQLRERRAASEQLHHALEKAKEEMLEEAIDVARRVELGDDLEDVRKAEAKLAELRAMTPEQKAAKAAREMEASKKKEAYLLIKKDDPELLKAFLLELPVEIHWQEWKDFRGRTLLKYAQDCRCHRVQEYLDGLRPRTYSNPWQSKIHFHWERDHHHDHQPAASSFSRQSSGSISGEAPAVRVSSGGGRIAEEQPPEVEVTPPEEGGEGGEIAKTPTNEAPVKRELSESPDRQRTRQQVISTYKEVSLEEWNPAEGEEEQLKLRAYRAVVQDNSEELVEVIEQVPPSVWSQWENRAGKDLLTLTEERGRPLAYSILATSLGMIQEIKKEAFEEKESVWVFLEGEVMPKRATVLEDTPEDADDVLIEFWDGDDEPVHMDKIFIRKMWS